MNIRFIKDLVILGNIETIAKLIETKEFSIHSEDGSEILNHYFLEKDRLRHLLSCINDHNLRNAVFIKIKQLQQTKISHLRSYNNEYDYMYNTTKTCIHYIHYKCVMFMSPAHESKMLSIEKLNPAHLHQTAIQLNNIMGKYEVNYQEACRWFLPEFQVLQFWFMQGKQLLNRSLNFDLFLKISSYISKLDPCDIASFYTKVAFHANKTFFISAMDNYLSLFKTHHQEATSLKSVCMNSSSSNELSDLLKDKHSSNEQESESKDDDYYKLIKKYHSRL